MKRPKWCIPFLEVVAGVMHRGLSELQVSEEVGLAVLPAAPLFLTAFRAVGFEVPGRRVDRQPLTLLRANVLLLLQHCF